VAAVLAANSFATLYLTHVSSRTAKTVTDPANKWCLCKLLWGTGYLVRDPSLALGMTVVGMRSIIGHAVFDRT
jgi:hypothetical protein